MSLEDHPRSRGVYGVPGRQSSWTVGSSPLARGLLKGQARKVLLEGIIPARAGFTASPWHGNPQTKDHPRSRGVYWRREARARGY